MSVTVPVAARTAESCLPQRSARHDSRWHRVDKRQLNAARGLNASRYRWRWWVSGEVSEGSLRW